MKHKQQLLESLLELLLPETVEKSPYYTQDDSPLGHDRHLKLVRAGKITGYKDGRKVFAKRDDVHAYIEDQKVAPRGVPANDDKPEREAVPTMKLLDKLAGI